MTMPPLDPSAQENLRKLAHDLRNALGAIYTNSQILEMTLVQQGLADEAETARSIFESAQKIQELITQRLDQ